VDNKPSTEVAPNVRVG